MKRNWLRERRVKKGYSQYDIAKLLGITRQAYTNYEGGNRKPGLNTALKLATILDFDPILFLDNEYAKRERDNEKGA